MPIDIAGAPLKEGQRVAILAGGPVYGFVEDITTILAPEGDAPAGAVRVTMRCEFRYYVPPNNKVPVPGTLGLSDVDETPGADNFPEPKKGLRLA